MPANKEKKEFFDAEITCRLLKEQATTHWAYIEYMRDLLFDLQNTSLSLKWICFFETIAIIILIIRVF